MDANPKLWRNGFDWKPAGGRCQTRRPLAKEASSAEPLCVIIDLLDEPTGRASALGRRSRRPLAKQASSAEPLCVIIDLLDEPTGRASALEPRSTLYPSRAGLGRVLTNSVRVRFAPKATETLHSREMTRSAQQPTLVDYFTSSHCLVKNGYSQIRFVSG